MVLKKMGVTQPMTESLPPLRKAHEVKKIPQPMSRPPEKTKLPALPGFTVPLSMSKLGEKVRPVPKVRF